MQNEIIFFVGGAGGGLEEKIDKVHAETQI